MRNIRLYSTEAAFQSYEESKGGDGVTTQTIVPGVSMSLNPRKRYFNPNDKTILVHTVTINYKDKDGNTIEPSRTKRFKYIPGVEEEIILTPAEIETYDPCLTKTKVKIQRDNSVDFIYRDDVKTLKNEYLTFDIQSGGTIYWKRNGYYTFSYGRTIEYSKDGGQTWISIRSVSGSGAPSIVVSAGDKLLFRGDYNTYAPGGYSNQYASFFSATTNTRFSVRGNIMSLIKSSGFSEENTLTGTYTFCGLFAGCSALISAGNLLLPATTLTTKCYYNMFSGCTSLTTAPSSIGNSATTVSVCACTYMFYNCTSLTTAPELPATTLTSYCYQYMFNGCTSLTTAPELPATTLVSHCYRYMFSGCTRLNYIKCLATNISASYCTSNWVNGVASSGTFEKDPNMTSWTTGNNGIPTNWAVQDATL